MFGTVSIRAGWFMALTSSIAICQQAEKRSTVFTLPDAPSATASSTAEILGAFDQASRSPATAGLLAPGNPMLLSDPRFRDGLSQDTSGKFFEKYLSRTAARRSRAFHPTPDGTVMARTKYAASSLLFQRDETGKKRLNTSYLLSVLASTAADSAKTPYWRRSASQPFSDFGSTVGNDAGMNVFHQFEPQLRQIAKSHAPRFLSRIGSEIESRIQGKVAGSIARR
jgi:hypothetical protein